MKKINIIFCVILSTSLVSCDKFLDKNPLDQISSNTFWNSPNDVDMALAGVYERLDVGTFNFNQAMLSVLAGDGDENVSGQGAGEGYRLLALGDILPTSGGIVSSIYNDCYKGISSCNFFLENVDRAPINDQVKQVDKAEVRFLRALFYFNLVTTYGGVPLYTGTVTVDEAKVKQSTKEEVVTQILDDLDFAINNLPNIPYTGHAVKGSAVALKAKVLLVNERWGEAANAANDLIQSGIFHLHNNFKELFLAVGQDNNPEIIFSTKYLNPDHASEQDIRLGWHAILGIRQELVDDYECTDGLPITNSPLYDPNDWQKNRDPRLTFTVRPFGVPVLNSSGNLVYFNENNISSSGLSPIKGLNVDALPVDYSTKSEQDWILLRYAEVLLMYAEAKNEDSGPDQTVYDAINEVRARPGVNMPPLASGLTKEQMREKIWHERRVELALEGKRYLDIRRWKLAETYIPTLVDPGGAQRKFDPSKNYIFPFPQSERDVNPNLDQNPNY